MVRYGGQKCFCHRLCTAQFWQEIVLFFGYAHLFIWPQTPVSLMGLFLLLTVHMVWGKCIPWLQGKGLVGVIEHPFMTIRPQNHTLGLVSGRSEELGYWKPERLWPSKPPVYGRLSSWELQSPSAEERSFETTFYILLTILSNRYLVMSTSMFTWVILSRIGWVW